MKVIHLHGAAGRLFGGPFSLDVSTPAEAIGALLKLIPGLEKVIRAASWRVIRGRVHIGADELGMTFGRADELHLIPVGRGRGGGGTGKVVVGAIIAIAATLLSPFTGGASLGAALAAEAAFGITYSSIAAFGVTLIFAGVAQMMAKSPQDPGANSREDKKQSFIFDGPVNVVKEGQPKPLVYGKKIRVGSVVGSAAISAEVKEG